MIGRKGQTQSMMDAIRAKKPAFITVTGRRRVGKTYLIEQVFKDYICFRLTGIQNHGIAAQLKNFTTRLAEHSNSPFVTQPANWQDAFIQLRAYLNTLPKNKKHNFYRRTALGVNISVGLFTVAGTFMERLSF